MQSFQNQTAAADGGVRRAALVAVAALALSVAAASVGGTAAAAPGENATAPDDEPRVVDASVHEVDDGQRVLVVVVETRDGTDAVVTNLDGGAADAGTAPTVDEFVGSNEIELPSATGGSLDLSNVSGKSFDHTAAADGALDFSGPSGNSFSTGDAQTGDIGASGAEGEIPGGSPEDADSTGAVDGGIIDEPVVDVPDALRSPPERLASAASRDPAFGGGWLLPGALAVLGGAMAALGVGAMAIWRRSL